MSFPGKDESSDGKTGKTIVLTRPTRRRTLTPTPTEPRDQPEPRRKSMSPTLTVRPEAQSLGPAVSRDQPEPEYRRKSMPPTITVQPEAPSQSEPPPQPPEDSPLEEPLPQPPEDSPSEEPLPQPPEDSPSEEPPPQPPEDSPSDHEELVIPKAQFEKDYFKDDDDDDPYEDKPLINEVEEMQMVPNNSYQSMSPSVRKRTINALKSMVKQINKTKKDTNGYSPIGDEDQSKMPTSKKIVQSFFDVNLSFIKYPAILQPPQMSENLKEGSNIGSLMSRKFLMPGLPRLLSDIWVFIELFVTLFQLLFSLVNTQFTSNRLFNSAYIILATTNTMLACIDAFLYYYELGSCRLCYKWCKGQSLDDDDNDDDENDNEEGTAKTPLCCCCPCFRLPAKWIKLFNQWFEVVRSVLSELLIYPLIILDLFELLGGGTFHPTNEQSRVSFCLFIVGSFYLVLSVYIGRSVMTISAIRSLGGLTSITTNDSSYTRVFVRFFLHVLIQIFVHLLCVIAVGLKIWQEDKSINGGTYIATPFLWAVMIGGWIIPFMGVVSFFVVNYYWLQQFSLGFFIDMIGLLEEPDFAEAVFQGKGVSSNAREKSEKLLEDVHYRDVKKEAKIRNENTNFVAKIVYPLKVPLMMMFAVFYNFVMGGFITSLLLDYDDNGNVTLITMNTGAGITTLVTIAFLIISNIHVILIINLWLVVVTVISFILMLFSPVFIVIDLIALIKKSGRPRDDQLIP